MRAVLLTAFLVLLDGSRGQLQQINTAPVDGVCLNCLCQFGCGITKPYWQDSGSPTIPGDVKTNPKAFEHCMNNLECTTSTIQSYMARFHQDCNDDGQVDCIDYAKIHMNGAYECKGSVPDTYKRQMELCLEKARQDQNQFPL